MSKHRLLRVNLSDAGLMAAGDASSYGSTTPLSINDGVQGGPHFVLSSVTPDNSHCYGFEFGLFAEGLANLATGPFDVTVWVLIGNSPRMDQTAVLIPMWMAMDTVSVGYNEAFHSFDVNASAIRFQIVDDVPDTTVSRSVIIALAEL